MTEPWIWPPSPTEVVAFATVFLGLVTAGLALVTRGMAKTTQIEIQAQWRPALVPGRTEAQSFNTSFGSGISSAPAIGLSGDVLSIALHNAGTGPALDIEAALVPSKVAMESLNDANVILAGEQRFLRFTLPQSLTPSNALRQSLTAKYWDLGGTRFETSVAVNFDPGTAGRTDDEGDTVGYTPDVSSFGLVSVRTLTDRRSGRPTIAPRKQ